MMRAARSALLLVAFYVLTAAATAYAECAWVMWTRIGTQAGPRTDWDIVQATPSRPDCIAALEKLARGLKEVVILGDIKAGQFTGVGNEKTSNDVYYGKCLPDTVDPRGPKR